MSRVDSVEGTVVGETVQENAGADSSITVWREVKSPLGDLYVGAAPEGVFSIDWARGHEEDASVGSRSFRRPKGGRVQIVDRPSAPDDGDLRQRATDLANQAAMEMQEYFQGRRKDFDVPLYLSGTDFQLAVWTALRSIPYGETTSYGYIAQAIGRPRAVRAVGQANRANRVAVMVPCHRVIGANGALVGYAGKHVDLKERLLDLERAWT